MIKLIPLSFLFFLLMGLEQNTFASDLDKGDKKTTSAGSFDVFPTVLLEKIIIETDFQTIGRLRRTCKKMNTWIDTILEKSKKTGRAVDIFGNKDINMYIQTFKDCTNSLSTVQSTQLVKKFFVSVFYKCSENDKFGEFVKYILPFYHKGTIFYNSDLFKFQRTVINPLFEELIKKPIKTTWESVFQYSVEQNSHAGKRNDFSYPTSLFALQFFLDKGVSINSPIYDEHKIEHEIITGLHLEYRFAENHPLFESPFVYVAHPVIQFLLKRGANVNGCFFNVITQDVNGVEVKPLLYETIKYYESHHATRKNRFKDDKNNDLCTNYMNEHYKLISLLLEHGADINAVIVKVDAENQTIYDYVLKKSDSIPEIRELLEKYRKKNN